MATVHKLILGGELWMPFALKKLRALEKLFAGKYANQSFIMPDGAQVSVRIAGQHHYLRITGGGPGYEFFTSEHLSPYRKALPGYPNKFVLGSGTRVKGLAAKPLFSDILTPKDDGPQWWQPVDPWLNFYKTDPWPGSALGDETIVENSKFFKTWASWQQEKGTEYTWWPNNGSSSLVTSTQSLSGTSLNQCGWFGLAGPPVRFGAYSDVGYDVPPAFYDKQGAKVGAPQLGPGVWWRRAAVQTATSDEHGGRDFFIMTDTHGQFHVYPVKPYQRTEPGGAGYLFLPPEKFKTFTPDYPEWVTRLPPGEAVGRREVVWTFNKDATKAVTIPMNSVPQKIWVPPTEEGGEYELKTLYLQSAYPRVVGFEPGSNPDAVEMRDDTSGLFEVGIKIELTGPDDMDFDVELTTGATSFYGTNTRPGDGRHYIDAGYLLKNKRLGDEAEEILGAPEDALLTAEIEIWGEPQRLARAQDDEDESESPYSYEDGTTDARTGAYQSSNITAYYVVREHSTQKEIRRTMLTQTCGWVPGAVGGRFSPYEVRGKAVSIQQADLRSLSYLFARYAFEHLLAGPDSPQRGYAASITEVHTANALVAGPVGINQALGQQEDFANYPPATCAPPVPTADFVKLPSDPRDEDAAKLIMQGAALAFCAGSLRNGIHVHPDGHWACGGGTYGDTEGALDVIQAYKGTTALKRTSHKKAFNKAFGQERDYSFYGAGQEVDEDEGGFQTTGIWVTF